MLGGAMLVIGLGFKLSLVPFHLWTPDVYEGAPAPVASYLATASKVAIFAVLMRYFVEAGGYYQITLVQVLSWLAFASRSEEHTSELQSLMRISYAVFCLKKKI